MLGKVLDIFAIFEHMKFCAHLQFHAVFRWWSNVGTDLDMPFMRQKRQ